MIKVISTVIKSWLSTFFIAATFFMVFLIIEQTAVDHAFPGHIKVLNFSTSRENEETFLTYNCEYFFTKSIILYRRVECNDKTVYDLPTQRIYPSVSENATTINRYIPLMKHPLGTMCVLDITAEYKPTFSLTSHVYKMAQIDFVLE
jgi:hypothetical protein